MKKFIFLLLILAPYIACSQVKNDQKLVLEKILNDKSLHTFFKDKEVIKLVKNKNCTIRLGAEFKIGNKVINVVDENSLTQPEALKFIGYENTENYIVVEITLFNINVVYSATFKKSNGQLKAMMTNTTFIKSPRN